MTGTAAEHHHRLLRAAHAVIAIERGWPRFWPVLTVVLVFLAVAWLDLLPVLPGWLHACILAGFCVALVAASVHWYRSRSPVALMEVRRRLERDSALSHRPLTALSDTVASGQSDSVALALWQRHRDAARAAAENLTLKPPRPDVARRDPRAVRALAVLAVVIGLVAGVNEPWQRLARAVTPEMSGAGQGPVAIDVWVTPPGYTRLPPVSLRWEGGQPAQATAHAPTSGNGTPADASLPPLVVPAGSAVLAKATGVTVAPNLVLGHHSMAFQDASQSETEAPTGWLAQTSAVSGNGLIVQAHGRTLVQWPLQIAADQPPEIAFANPPVATPAAFVGVSYVGRDDYGIEGLTAIVRHAEGKDMPGGATEIRLDVPVQFEAASGEDIRGISSHDLTPHAWAGERVLVGLEAVDAVGQVGNSQLVELILPERTFNHPVAKDVVGVRKELTNASREQRELVSAALDRIAAAPQYFAHDSVVSLALAVAAGRLRHDQRLTMVTSVRSILWQTALRLEQGSVPVAEQALREARQRLWDGLRSDTDDQEIERLINELEQALDEYLEAVAAELARKGDADLEMPPLGEIIRDQDLRDLIDAARDLARAGARDSARQLLSELQRILDQIRGGMNAPSQTQEMVQAHRLLNELRDLAARQQALLDQTYKDLKSIRERSRAGVERRPGRSSDDTQTGASVQESLRRELGEAMRQFDALMGEIPGTLGEAERAMKGAGQALQRGALGDAVPQQGRAVERLRAATEDAASMMAQRFGGGQPGMFSGGMTDTEGGSQDPFGRSGSQGLRGLNVEQVDIPDRMQRRQVEEVLEELRRRAGEYDRSQKERDYIKRLLKRF